MKRKSSDEHSGEGDAAALPSTFYTFVEFQCLYVVPQYLSGQIVQHAKADHDQSVYDNSSPRGRAH
jgi:hypothetical protein